MPSVVGAGPYMDSSDARFKKNVATVTDALSKVLALNAVSIHSIYIMHVM